MNIEIWSDFLCPFCYIGKRRLENVLEQFPHRDEVKLQFKSFELDPNAALNPGKTNSEYLAAKYNMSVEQAKGMNAQMNANARTAGLEYNIDAMIPTNSFSAHRLTHWADTQGKALELSERIFQAVFIEGKHSGDPEVLAQLAEEVGLDRNAATAVLSSDQFTDNVRADQAEGEQLGIRGVPFSYSTASSLYRALSLTRCSWMPFKKHGTSVPHSQWLNPPQQKQTAAESAQMTVAKSRKKLS